MTTYRADPGIPDRLLPQHPDTELKRLLAPHPAPAEYVQADPAGHGGEPPAQVLDAPAAGAGQSQPRLLHGVVRVRVRAEHAERDRVEIRTMGFELGGELFFFGHGLPHPSGGITGRTHHAAVR
jgi:hypothetical protein